MQIFPRISKGCLEIVKLKYINVCVDQLQILSLPLAMLVSLQKYSQTTPKSLSCTCGCIRLSSSGSQKNWGLWHSLTLAQVCNWRCVTKSKEPGSHSSDAACRTRSVSWPHWREGKSLLSFVSWKSVYCSNGNSGRRDAWVFRQLSSQIRGNGMK